MSGLPGIDALSTYGGEKDDYAPIEDQSTDLSASHWNLVASNVAGMTHTVCRAWRTFTAGNPPTDPASNVHDAVWGNDVSVKPTVSRSSTGIYLVTWPSSVTDELGESHSTNIRRAWVCLEATLPYFSVATRTSATVVSVLVWDSSGVLTDPSANITVFVV